MNLVETNRRAWHLWGEYLVCKEQMAICTQTIFTIATIRKLQMLPIAPASFWILVGTKATIKNGSEKSSTGSTDLQFLYSSKAGSEGKSDAIYNYVYHVSNSLTLGNSFQLLHLASMSLTVGWITLLQNWWASPEDARTQGKGSCKDVSSDALVPLHTRSVEDLQ